MRGIIVFVGALTAAGALGCSDGHSAGAGAADGSGGGAEASSDGAGGSGASGGRDAGTADAQGDAGGVLPIYPVAVGYSWTYDVVPLGAGDTCGSGTRTTTVVRDLPLDGKNAFELAYFCSEAPIFVSPEGDRLYFHTGVWELALDAPVAEGHAWNFISTSTTRTWHRIGPLSVPAGNFADCWEAHQEEAGALRAKFTYCRGVGLVLAHAEDVGGDGSDVTLISKNF